MIYHWKEGHISFQMSPKQTSYDDLVTSFNNFNNKAL